VGSTVRNNNSCLTQHSRGRSSVTADKLPGPKRELIFPQHGSVNCESETDSRRSIKCKCLDDQARVTGGLSFGVARIAWEVVVGSDEQCSCKGRRPARPAPTHRRQQPGL